jgi:DNA polymerase III alpha subunit (gram-positive type)
MTFDHENHNYMVFDTETTGLDEEKNCIIEIGLTILDGGSYKEYGEYETFVQIYGEGEIEAKAMEVTGITMQQIEGGLHVVKMVTDLINMAKEFKNGRYKKPILVAHNAPFDRKFIVKAFELAGKCLFDHFELDFEDTMKMSRAKWVNEKGHKLSDLCERLNIPIYGSHRAMNDVRPTVKAFVMFKKLLTGEVVVKSEGSSEKRFREKFKFQF